MRNLLILFCFAGLFTASCHQAIGPEQAKKKLEALVKVPISNNIKISDYETSSDVQGTYTEAFIIHFDDKEEFDSIFNKVQPSKSEYFNVYGYGVEYGSNIEPGYKSISAVFNPEQQTIKYSYFEN